MNRGEIKIYQQMKNWKTQYLPKTFFERAATTRKMSLLSRDLQAKTSYNLQSLEGIEGQKGYGVIDNTNGTVIHVGRFNNWLT